MITKTELLDRLYFDNDGLKDAEILKQQEIEPYTVFVLARLSNNNGQDMIVPFVVPEKEDWLFAPYDWQEPFFDESFSINDIDKVEWHVNDTEQFGIMFNGCPRIFGFEPEVVRRETRKAIGKEIKKAREVKGYTTRELANLCGVQYSHISRIEAGRYNVSIDTLAVICRALGLSLDITQY